MSQMNLCKLAAHKDRYLAFHREGVQYDIKLRPSAFLMVSQEKPELRDFEISGNDLRKFVSKRSIKKAEGSEIMFLV